MTYGPYSFLTDFALMSVLLLLAQYLKAKVPLVQKLLLPASLVAGLLGILGGPYFLNLLPFSDKIVAYPYLLVVVLFSSLFIGAQGDGSLQKTVKETLSLKKILNEVGDTFFINSATYFGQYATALLIGGGILTFLYPEVPKPFSVLMPAGFIGGNGAAAAFGSAFKDLLNWDEALYIGQTFATIGLLVGVIGGVAVINIGARCGATRFIKKISELSESMRTGFVPESEQTSMGRNTVNPMSIDPLTWHFLLVAIAAGGGYYTTRFLSGLTGVHFPMFALGMICGAVLQLLLLLLGLDKYVDKEVITRIGSSATDYMVGFGIASIKISVVIKYEGPILILSTLGIIFCCLYLGVVARKLFHNFWFERGIFIFGWATGVLAIGVTLLRIVDPEFKSKTLEDYAMAYVFCSIFEVSCIAILPILLAKGYLWASGLGCLVIFLVLLGLCIRNYGISRFKADELRPGEAEVLAQEKKHQV